MVIINNKKATNINRLPKSCVIPLVVICPKYNQSAGGCDFCLRKIK
jgi:hypothetical protein